MATMRALASALRTPHSENKKKSLTLPILAMRAQPVSTVLTKEVLLIGPVQNRSKNARMNTRPDMAVPVVHPNGVPHQNATPINKTLLVTGPISTRSNQRKASWFGRYATFL
jgi:hypothetical protein